MKLFVGARAGIWCQYASGWDQWLNALRTPPVQIPAAAEPWPDCLPARECRRSPLHVRLAIEAAASACRENAVAMDGVASVFASAMGDSEITDYMCRTLAGDQPVLSPTRFHNSVHNAASGYWSIAAGNRQPSTAVAAGPHTLGLALLEAGLMAGSLDCPVLVVCHDVAAKAPLDAVAVSRQSYAVGLVIAGQPGDPEWQPLELLPITGPVTPTSDVPEWVRLADCDPNLLAGLSFLRGLASPQGHRLRVSCGKGSGLEIRLGEQAAAN